jgi:hypothetical protein
MPNALDAIVKGSGPSEQDLHDLALAFNRGYYRLLTGSGIRA